ncbi:MAG: hypothetical protein HC913_16485 [Microscillaceae bacterium]|nr:hypothetical protein [Microscillaceae bacterium]
MKKISFLFILIAFASANGVWADPEDCMSRAEAEALVKKIKKERYLVDYCDCCNDVGTGVTANLLLVKKAVVVSCEYDTERFSVKMEAQMLASFKVRDQEYAEKAAHEGNTWNLALLNYQYFLEKGQARHLGFALRPGYEAPRCSGLKSFPPAALLNDKKYSAWLAQKGL